ncbi:MFS transporter [Sphingomicrobium astaxanthinifaciens]|uniref:MFS transporter n=1 Tax=Sphingomicrobium astaxanthinifaciens TaxID=1227949 RepID=UPI001FCCB088|nr:MFS transporter [Sphingomicrobium astaxanthinifaciens]MCJ7421350.1 MFS transporter [Sphingomicrobium astaxanthinifaciens]
MGAAATPFGRVPGSALSRRDFALLWAAMLVTATGNTAMQTIIPPVGRSLGIADYWMALAFTTSAVAWVVCAPIWARRSDKHGRKPLVLIGLGGFIVSTLGCAVALQAGLAGWIGVVPAMLGFAVVRALYGLFGCATPAGTQAYLAARTRRSARTVALSGLTAAFGLGTVIGPALVPVFALPGLELVGPLYVFAGVGLLTLAAVGYWLPDDRARVRRARAAAMGFPSASPTGAAVRAATSAPSSTRLRWTDPRVRDWLVAGAITNTALAGLLTVMGFYVIDQLGLDPAGALGEVGLVLMGGAVASLVAQWGLIPRTGWAPRQLIRVGAVVAILGTLAVMVAASLHALVLGYAIACLGFGLTRPGFAAGASLAVPLAEQGAVAGLTTSVNGFAFIFAPTATLLLYHLAPWLAFATLVALLALSLALFGRGRAG